MALQYKLSDALDIVLTKDPISFKPVIMIEFKFVHYRLVVDDEQKAVLLYKLLQEALKPQGRKENKVKLPRFYKE